MNENPSGQETAEASTEMICPLCRGAINKDAIRCRHCGSDVIAALLTVPQHQGSCPFCKESINPEATICRYCKSSVVGPVVGPSHSGTCPFCKDQIDPKATVCPACRSGLVQGSTARLNETDDRWGHQQCVNRLYDYCVSTGRYSRLECYRAAERACTRAGSFDGGVAFAGAGNTPAAPTGGGMPEAMARIIGPDRGLQPDGTIIYRERCWWEPYWICDARGCRTAYARVCISYPE